MATIVIRIARKLPDTSCTRSRITCTKSSAPKGSFQASLCNPFCTLRSPSPSYNGSFFILVRTSPVCGRLITLLLTLLAAEMGIIDRVQTTELDNLNTLGNDTVLILAAVVAFLIVLFSTVIVVLSCGCCGDNGNQGANAAGANPEAGAGGPEMGKSDKGPSDRVSVLVWEKAD